MTLHIMSNAPTITPEDAARVLAANWKNLVKRVSAGKTLNAAELALLRARAAESHESVALARDVSELSRVLGVTRQTMHAWLKREGAPEANADGSHDVVAWRRYIEEAGLKGATLSETESLKARKLLAEIEDRELKVSLKKGLYVLKSAVRQEWLTRIGQARALLEARLLNELPPVIAGKKPTAIRQELERVILEFYRTLHTGGKPASS